MPNPIFEELRGSLDGQDPFMTGGHQVIKLRQGNRKTPIWAVNNKQIQELLLRSFPALKTNPKQRMRAARWALFIQLYFRAHVTERQIAERMGVSMNTVKMLARNIRRAAARVKGRPRGRPKNS